MKKFTLIFLTIPFFIFAQSQHITKDTSYTAYSALKKEIINYPFIQIVQPVLPNNINSLRNITYAKYKERELKLDLFFSQPDSVFRPGVILIHGGGWRSGDKSLLAPLALKLAEKGFVAATMEYRLSPEAIFPSAVLDITNSIKWLKINGSHFGIDSNKISVLGSSAGGQLASLVGFAQNENIFEDSTNYLPVSSKVHAIVNIDGLLDFLGKGSEEFDEIPDPRNPRSAHKWLGASQIENPDIWRQASGINYINKNSCPILFINSSIPRFHAGRDEGVEKLSKFEIYYEVHSFEDSPHSFWLFHPWFDRTVEKVTNFLNKVLY